MSNSINTNISAYYAQANITTASSAAQSSVARLSSGNRIVQASDDVAALATGTSLATQVNSLKTAQTVASQGSSLLQVADGALAQQQAVLQQMQSLAQQAASGSLTNTDRGFLNQQFSSLRSEIDSLASGTTFNGVQLLDGSIAAGANVATNVTNGSTTTPFASSTIGTIGTVGVNDTFTLKVAGQPTQTFTFGTATGDVGIGTTAADSAANLASAINNSGLSQLSDFRVVASGANLTAFYTGSASSLTNIPTLTSGTNNTATVTATGAASFANGTTLANFSSGTINNNDTFTIGTHTITFVTSGATGAQVNIGGSNTNALANLVTYLNTNAGTSGFSDIAGITFSKGTDGGTGQNLYGIYTAGGSTQPALTTSYTVNAPINYTGGTSLPADGAAKILTLDGNSLTNDGATTLNVDGVAITFNNTGTTSGASIAYGSNLLGTGVSSGAHQLSNALTDIVSYLNGAGNASLTHLTGSTFSTDGTSLFVTNPGNTPLGSITTTLANAATPGETLTGGAATVANGTAALFTAASGIVSTDTFVLDGKTFTAGTDFSVGTSDTQALANLAAYLNGVTGQAALNTGTTGALHGLTFSSDATGLYVTNPTTSATAAVSISQTGGHVTAHAAYGSGLPAAGSSNVVTLAAGSEIAQGSTLSIGGQTVTFGTSAGGANVVIGNSGTIATDAATTLTNLATYLNSIKGVLTGNYNNVTFSRSGLNLVATNSTSSSTTVGGTITLGAITAGSGTPSGASVVTNATIAAPSLVGSFTGSGSIVAGDTITITGAAGLAQTFTFSGGASSGNTVHVTAGDLSTTLAALVTQANGNAVLGTTNHLVFSKDGSGHLYAQDANAGATTTVTTSYTGVGTTAFTGQTNVTVGADSVSGLGAGVTSAVGTPGGSLLVTDASTTNPAPVTNYGNGVDLSKVANNADFIGAFGGTGSIGAITASYVNTGTTSTSGVQFSVKVGNDTYTTNTITNAALTSSAAPVSILFTGSNTTTSAAEGGSFTLTLQPQSNVTSQNGASQLATGINAALSSVSAYQNRNVLSYNNNYTASVGGVLKATLQGSSLAFNSGDFTNASISSVSVSAPSAGSTDAKISAVVNGQTFSTGTGIGDIFAANNEIVLVNQNNPNQTLTLTLGSAGSADVSNSANASAFQTALSSAMGLGHVSGGLTFQLGSTVTSDVSVSIASATSSSLFAGAALDISTSDGASAANTAVGDALNTVTALRAGVGALESQFNFASAALQSATQNEDAARSALLDTNITTESTAYATEQVKLQAGISVLAQANQQTQALLKLIG